jgi:hypothetical protein
MSSVPATVTITDADRHPPIPKPSNAAKPLFEKLLVITSSSEE